MVICNAFRGNLRPLLSNNAIRNYLCSSFPFSVNQSRTRGNFREVYSAFGRSTPCCYSSSNAVDHRVLKKARNEDKISLIKNVKTITGESTFQITWDQESSHSQLFPFVWLRDHCQCEKCFHPVSRSRTMLFDDLVLNVYPTDIKVIKNSVLDIKWSDGHKSQYKSEWLQERGFSRSNSVLKRPSAYKLNQVFWGSEILENLPTAKFYDLMSDDGALLTWLQQLEVFGFVLINNAPAEYGQVKQLVERVTFIKETHYGAEFSVKAKPDPSNVAYSTGPLQLHTDLPYYDYKPGLQLIHCVVQLEGVGGESQVADAAHVARELRKNNLEMFKILTETYVDWCDIGNDEGREFFKILRRPVICLDSDGEIERVNFSHPQRDSFFNVDVKTVFKWYEAMKVFQSMLYDPQYCLQFKMTPGTIQSFDNLRIVHGRRSYEENAGERIIEGCYMDWDEVRSKRRVLEGKLKLSSDQWSDSSEQRSIETGMRKSES